MIVRRMLAGWLVGVSLFVPVAERAAAQNRSRLVAELLTMVGEAAVNAARRSGKAGALLKQLGIEESSEAVAVGKLSSLDPLDVGRSITLSDRLTRSFAEQNAASSQDSVQVAGALDALRPFASAGTRLLDDDQAVARDLAKSFGLAAGVGGPCIATDCQNELPRLFQRKLKLQ